jgi:hypothetical protein
VDDNTEKHLNTVSVFNGPPPKIVSSKNGETGIADVAVWIKKQVADGLLLHEIGVIVWSGRESPRAEAVLNSAGVPYKVLDDHVANLHGFASVSTIRPFSIV